MRYGYRHIDTAELYRNEESVGNAVRDFLAESGVPREDVWVTTKLWPNNKNYNDVKISCQQSLNRLGLDYIDLYLIHSPYDQAHRLEQWRALIDLQKEGIVKSIGVSNYGIHHIEELWSHFEIKPAVNQFELTPYLTRTDLVSFCQEHDIVVESYSPLTKGIKLSDSKLISLAEKYQCTPAQLLLQWNLQHNYVTIPKSVTPSRIQENLETLSHFKDNLITDDDLKLMDQWNEELVTGWDPTVSR